MTMCPTVESVANEVTDKNQDTMGEWSMRLERGITGRQLHTLVAVANGATVTQVAERFGVTATTVSSNLGRAVDNIIKDAAAKRMPTVPGDGTADVCAKLAVGLGYVEIRNGVYQVHPRYGLITHRQRELLIDVAQGKTASRIQHERFITRNSYVTHMRRVRKQLGAVSNTNAVAIAFHLRILGGDDLK